MTNLLTAASIFSNPPILVCDVAERIWLFVLCTLQPTFIFLSTMVYHGIVTLQNAASNSLLLFVTSSFKNYFITFLEV